MPYIKEELLHHIWQHGLFNSNGLKTTDGVTLEIIRPGELNRNAGPDFQNARLVIDGTKWAGNVEIHVRSSDWLKHKHQNDPAYENIILHAVFEDDLEQGLGLFPTIELRKYISDQILRRYEKLVGTTESLSCGNLFIEVPKLTRTNWLDSLFISRIERKSGWIKETLDRVHGDLEQVFMMTVFRAFGMKVNALGFELLGLITPWRSLGKYRDNLFQLEAILFGNAGFLKFPEDDYQEKLSKEFDFLENKHGTGGLDTGIWKFSQMHPRNFPTLRLAQLSALLHTTGQFIPWFAKRSTRELIDGLMVTPSEYWQTHYRFGKAFPTKGNRVGRDMAESVLINAYVPFLFVLAQRQAKPELQDRAIQILEELKPEENAKTKPFKNVGFKPANAAESQALIELKTNYCDHKKCLFCSIGANILKREL